MDIILDTPVLVLPRSSCSSQVFVVHLGKISISNSQTQEQSLEIPMKKYQDSQYKIFTIDEEMFLKTPNSNENNLTSNDAYVSEEDLRLHTDQVDGTGRNVENYVLDVRNMNVYSLDTKSRKNFRL